jgi:nucleotide-binding universal stress UspA family protein
VSTSGFELGTDGPRVVVAAVDGSRTSLRAAAYAGGLCRRQDARLVVVYVVAQPFGAGMLAGAAPYVASALDDTARTLRAQVAERAEQLGLRASFVVRHGDPYGEVCRLCAEVRAEAVVVGASANPGHRLAGSLAVRLVRTGRWPVTVVP